MQILFILNKLDPKISQTIKLKKIYSTLNANSVRQIHRLDLLHKPFLDKLSYLNLDKFSIKEVDAVNNYRFGIGTNEEAIRKSLIRDKNPTLLIDNDVLSNGLCVGHQTVVDYFKEPLLKAMDIVNTLILKDANVDVAKESSTIDVKLLYEYSDYVYNGRFSGTTQLFSINYTVPNLVENSGIKLQKSELSNKRLGIIELSKDTFEKHKELFHYIQLKQLFYLLYSNGHISKQFHPLLKNLPIDIASETIGKISGIITSYFSKNGVSVYIEETESEIFRNLEIFKSKLKAIKALDIPVITAIIEYLEDPNTFLKTIDISDEICKETDLGTETSTTFEKILTSVKEFALKSNDVERPVILEIVKDPKDIDNLKINNIYQETLDAYEFLNNNSTSKKVFTIDDLKKYCETINQIAA